MCADSGNRVETAVAAWQWRRKEWSNAKKIPPERLQKETDREGKKQEEKTLKGYKKRQTESPNITKSKCDIRLRGSLRMRRTALRTISYNSMDVKK